MDHRKILQNKKWKNIGGSIYQNTETGEVRSEQLEAELAELPVGFRYIGEINPNSITGLMDETI